MLLDVVVGFVGVLAVVVGVYAVYRIDRANKSVATARDLIDDAEESRLLYETARAGFRTEYTLIQPHSEGDDEYLRELSVVFDNDCFSFFLFKTRQEVIHKLTEGTSEQASELQGILKGVELVMKTLGDRKAAYQQRMAEANDG